MSEYNQTADQRQSLATTMLLEPYRHPLGIVQFQYTHFPGLYGNVPTKGVPWTGFVGLRTAGKWLGGRITELGQPLATVAKTAGMSETARSMFTVAELNVPDWARRGSPGVRAAGKWVSRVFGGTQTSLGKFRFAFGPQSAATKAAGLSSVEGQAVTSVLRGRGWSPMRLRGVIRTERLAAKEIEKVSLWSALFRRTKVAGEITGKLDKGFVSYLTKEAVQANVRRGLWWQAGARAAAAGAGLANIALVASIVGPMAYYGAKAVADTSQALISKIHTLEMGTGVFQPGMTMAATTERRRAIQMIQGSQLNARSAIGNEARLAHETPF